MSTATARELRPLSILQFARADAADDRGTFRSLTRKELLDEVTEAGERLPWEP